MVGRAVALIEDSSLAQSMADCFSKNGLEVSLADSVEQAKGFISDNPPQLVISEIHLKRGDVFELLSFCKSHLEKDDVPFVMLSVHPSKVARHLRDSLNETATKLGADRCITMDEFDCEILFSQLNGLF